MTLQEKRRYRRHRKQRLWNIVHSAILFCLTVAIILVLGNIYALTVMSTDTLNQITDLRQEVDEVRQSIDQAQKVAVIDEKTPSDTTYSSGDYAQVQDMVLTHYCACEKCCGKYADGITATGTKATANKTIAVDPNVIPLGSEVLIDGQLYIAEDTGGAIKGNRIDIFCDSHQEAINRGKIQREVVVIETY